MKGKSSRISGFYKMTHTERIAEVVAFADLDAQETALLERPMLDFTLADSFIENAVGSFPLPLGIATNFVVDGKDVLVPMAVEESSVVAAASNGARLCRPFGGFTTELESQQMIGQIELYDIEDPDRAVLALRAQESHWKATANATNPFLAERGAGCQEVEVRVLRPRDGSKPFIVVHLLVDPLDAMGANTITTMCETLAGPLAHEAGGKAGLRILSNYADRRIVRATCTIETKDLKRPSSPLSGAEVRDAIVRATRFADTDPYRAATHNKGIMNGIDPVVIATGNDWRAVEAGCHAFAARSGQYRALSQWAVDDEGNLQGTLRVPMQVGTVGGVTRIHPLAQIALKLLGSPDAASLAGTLAAVGLAQNLTALRALVAEGIQYGHMRLHTRNLALAAGAEPHEVDEVVRRMVDADSLDALGAETALGELRNPSVRSAAASG